VTSCPAELLLPAACHVAARSAARRKHKQWKQQQKAKQAWSSTTDRQEVQYQVVMPAPDALLTPPPQFFDPDSDLILLPEQGYEDVGDLWYQQVRGRCHTECDTMYSGVALSQVTINGREHHRVCVDREI
jgi:hypothetical protein